MFPPNFRLFWRKSGIPHKSGVEFFRRGTVVFDFKNHIFIRDKQLILSLNKIIRPLHTFRGEKFWFVFL